MHMLSETKVAGGLLGRYQHESISTNTPMTFAVFMPPQAGDKPVPVLYWLSGLTCNDENFCQKAGAFKTAAALGLAIVCPDTSPRGTDLPGEHDSWDLGSGAGFYLTATEAPWSGHYNMFDYVTQELPAVVEKEFAVSDKRSISGHSMGGHGALVCALKNPGMYQSVSAFAPISNPSKCPWGEKAFSHYLGSDQAAWSAWDASELVAKAEEKLPLLIDQGSADTFYIDGQLLPENLVAACHAAGHTVELRIQEGYDHSYFFISSFIDEHLQHHAAAHLFE